jgi:AcrR family transcriptional regulator
MVLFGTLASDLSVMPRKTSQHRPLRVIPTKPVRERVIGAAFSAFMELGYAGASTLEIATRAKVSKRELYALFEDKQAMLAACISERAKRMRLPLELPAPRDLATLTSTLSDFGTTFLREMCQPAVMAVYRLAITEADRCPEVAQILESAGREPNRRALIDLLADAQAHHLLGAGDPSAMATEFFALLWRDLLIRLLLRATDPPTPTDIERRARAATEALFVLHPSKKIR